MDYKSSGWAPVLFIIFAAIAVVGVGIAVNNVASFFWPNMPFIMDLVTLMSLPIVVFPIWLGYKIINYFTHQSESNQDKRENRKRIKGAIKRAEQDSRNHQLLTKTCLQVGQIFNHPKHFWLGEEESVNKALKDRAVACYGDNAAADIFYQALHKNYWILRMVTTTVYNRLADCRREPRSLIIEEVRASMDSMLREEDRAELGQRLTDIVAKLLFEPVEKS